MATAFKSSSLTWRKLGKIKNQKKQQAQKQHLIFMDLDQEAISDSKIPPDRYEPAAWQDIKRFVAVQIPLSPR